MFIGLFIERFFNMYGFVVAVVGMAKYQTIDKR